ncbi:MAG: biotin/lipoyl-containing protein, partial [Vicinamibacterales bacterium]
MAVDVTVPQSGESIREVQIGAWRRAEGDQVAQDEILVQIETDKAAMDLPAPVSGVLKVILKKQGEEAKVGDVIATIEEGAGPPAERPKTAAAPAAAASAVPASAAAKPPAPARTAAPSPAPTPVESGRPDGKGGDARVMPSARRAAAQQGVDPAHVTGTGPGGRVTKEDVERQASPPAQESAPAIEKEPVPAERPAAIPATDPDDDRYEEVVPMSPMRRTIARNLVEAQQTAALLTTFNEADMSAVVAMR